MLSAVSRRTGLPQFRQCSVRGAREQQLQVIVELGHRADGRARGAHRIRLVDGDGRRNAIDAIHRGLVHAVEELARVRRERLDVTPLALGVQRVEHQRGLARARHAGHDHQFAQRNLEVEVLQIVLARAADADRFARRCGRCRHRLVGEAAGAAAKDSRSLGEVGAKCRCWRSSGAKCECGEFASGHVAAVCSVPGS